MGVKAIYLSILYLLFFNSLFAQSTQNEFLEAKRLFEIGDYLSAKGAFAALNNDKTFAEYAYFYQALSNYKNGDTSTAVMLWEEVLSLYPRWNKINEVLYWLALTNFETGNIDEGLNYLNSYTYNSTSSYESKRMVPLYLKGEPIEKLLEYSSMYPENEEIARLLAQRVDEQPYSIKDSELLEELIRKFDFNRSELVDVSVENVYRSEYSIALVLPFMFESLDNPNTVIQNSLINNMYQGMVMAREDLAAEGIILNFFNYDTQKDSTTTTQILDHLKDADLIVGPLYPGPISAVADYSRNMKVNMVNPLTSNIDYIGNNPFAFILKPSYETMAKKLGEFVIQHHQNPYSLIYFSKTERDSLFAETYKKVIEDAGFVVMDFRGLDGYEAKILYDTLSETFEEYYTKEIADSIAEIEGRYIKFRKLKEEEEKAYEDAEEGVELTPFFYEEPEEGTEIDKKNDQKMVAYEMKLKVKKDSIGHIMIASRLNSIANSFMSALAAREDSAGLYGYGNWFDFSVFNYELLEQLQVKVAFPEFINKSSYRYQELNERFITSFGLPTSYHFVGYDFIRFIGKMLNKNGKYFQNGFNQIGYTPGFILEGYSFPGTNDNQVVPIITIKNLEMKSVNEDQYGN